MLFTNDRGVHVQRQRICLLDGDSLLLRKRQGTELRVLEASPAGGGAAMLWVTEEGFADDVFLRPGETHRLRGHGRVVATAWGELQLRAVSPREAAAMARDALRRESSGRQRPFAGVLAEPLASAS